MLVPVAVRLPWLKPTILAISSWLTLGVGIDAMAADNPFDKTPSATASHTTSTSTPSTEREAWRPVESGNPNWHRQPQGTQKPAIETSPKAAEPTSEDARLVINGRHLYLDMTNGEYRLEGASHD